ncbi:hypothetical protein [Paenibacillus alvei]|uniref:Uncharacterized protein n=1 Tax=Paenibacillus alvei TaxID=44250 RepID=A0AAP7A2D6_PAEAL|nr:hypothetical protein [Paenibacillus alvei]NOJ72136.1 hypothetical protein [Paenibacillus alvei]
MKIKRVLPFLSAVVALILVFSTNVHAAELNKEPISTESILNIKRNLTAMGVDPTIQAKLIIKLEKGELWDSMNPHMADQGSVTKHTITDHNKNKVYQTKTTFPDGSVTIVSVTTHDPSSSTSEIITPLGISGGTSSCGSGYCTYFGVKVYGGNGVISANFLADYTLVNGGPDYIDKVYQGSAKAQVGTTSDLKEPTILRAMETDYQSASANMSWTYSAPVTGNATQYLILNVGNNSATSEFTT